MHSELVLGLEPAKREFATLLRGQRLERDVDDVGIRAHHQSPSAERV